MTSTHEAHISREARTRHRSLIVRAAIATTLGATLGLGIVAAQNVDPSSASGGPGTVRITLPLDSASGGPGTVFDITPMSASGGPGTV